MLETLSIKINKLKPEAIIPTQGSKYAAGYDLYSLEDYNLKFSERHLFKIGISIQIPEGYYGRIAPRSGLALKQGINVLAGVIDSDYSGELGVILINSSLEHFDNEARGRVVSIKKGDRIAQLIIEKCHSINWIEDKLEETTRGSGGYGSSGQ